MLLITFDPANRLVADTLEADWNQKLRALADAQEECERQQRADRDAIGEQQREAVMALSRDFQRVWDNPNTPDRERKRIVRLLLEDVTLVRREQISVHIRFRGGVTQSFTLPLPQSAAQLRKTKPAVIAEIDRLLNTTPSARSRPFLTRRDSARAKASCSAAHSSCGFATLTISKIASRDSGRLDL